MGFLAGFTQGLGSYAQDVSKKMLDLRTAGANHMADLYSKLAENYKTNPALFGEYLKRSQAYNRLAMNPFDQGAFKETQAYTDPGEPLRNFINTNVNEQHTQLTGQPAGKDFLIGGKAPAVGAPGVAPGPISQAISQGPQAQSLSATPTAPASTPPAFGPNAVPPPQFHYTPWGEQETNPAFEVFQRGQDAYTQARAAQQAMFDTFSQRAGGAGGSGLSAMFGETGAPQGSTLDRLVKDQWVKDAMFKRPPTKPTSSYPINGHPASFFNGGHFINGEPVNESSANAGRGTFKMVTDKGTGKTYWDWFAPNDPRLGPNGTVVEALPSEASTTTTSPTDLSKHTVKSRGFGGAAAAPPPKAGVAGVVGEVNKLTAPPSDTTSGPDIAERLTSATDKTQLKKRNSARDALNLMTGLDDTLRANKDLIGAAAGRVYGALNRVGLGSAINWVRSLGIFGHADDSNISPQEADQRINQIIDATNSVAGDKTAPENVRSGAVALGEIITQMRALNGLELVTMSGSGNGITRLYMMLKDVMLNPNQSYDLIYGHERGLASLFASTDNGYNASLGKTWKNLDPETQQMYERFGAGRYFKGYTPSVSGPPTNKNLPPSITAKSGVHKGQPLFLGPDGNYHPQKPNATVNP